MEANMKREAKVGMYESTVEPSLLYGTDVWELNVHKRNQIEVVEVNYSRNICGVRGWMESEMKKLREDVE